jgi:hypothetical protein
VIVAGGGTLAVETDVGAAARNGSDEGTGVDDFVDAGRLVMGAFADDCFDVLRGVTTADAATGAALGAGATAIVCELGETSAVSSLRTGR